ncbi:MAG: DUF4230 domain-containing protein [Thermoclostridium sp.]|nr:DUF4230 domain-containing protein [Thermoclostridium sp.]
MENKEGKRMLPALVLVTIIVVALAMMVIAVIVFLPQMTAKQENKPVIITASQLKKIISISKLSTYRAYYNGIAQVMNDEKPGEVDYYVSYESTVDAGIDFERLEISVDPELKRINIVLPDVHITEVDVKAESLDYIFKNKKAEEFSVSREALMACEADVKQESELQTKIFELAKQNAKNVLIALTKPIVEQLDSDYTLIIE